MAIAIDEQDATQEQIEQLKTIEKQIAAEQQLIEERYEQQVEILLKSAENRAKKLGTSYRVLWIKYYDMIENAAAEDSYLLTSNSFVHRVSTRRTKTIDSSSLYKARTFLLDKKARKFVAYIAGNINYGDHGSLLRSNARKVLKIMSNLQLDLSRHQQYRLRALSNLEETEKNLRKDVLTVASPAQQQPKAVVSATAYVEKNWIAMIGDKVVHEGDTIANVKILKIDEKKVQFEKNDQTWSQKLGENQEALWE